jgi:hypothetical protein
MLAHGIGMVFAGILGWGASGTSGDEPIKVRFLHTEGCRSHERGIACGQADHWRVEVGTHKVEKLSELAESLKKEREGRQAPAADETVTISGSGTLPWSYVTQVLEFCSSAGIYKIDWQTRDRGEEKITKAWLPHDRKQEPEEKLKRELVVVHLKWDPTLGAALRSVGDRTPVLSDDDLMQYIILGTADYKKLGRTDNLIRIDASVGLPWISVIHVMELCRKEKLEPFEFMLPASSDGGPGK